MSLLDEIRKELELSGRDKKRPKSVLDEIRGELGVSSYNYAYADPNAVGPPEAPEQNGRTWGEAASDVAERYSGAFEEGAALALELPVNAANAINTHANPVAWAWQALDPSVPTTLRQPEALAGTAEQIRLNVEEELKRDLSPTAQARKAELAGIMQPKEDRGFFGEARDVAGFFAKNPGAMLDEGASVLGTMTSPGGVVPGAKELTVIAQALQAGGASAHQVRTELIKQGASPEEAERAATTAFTTSAVVNTVLPTITPGGTSTEGLIAGAVRGVPGRSAARAITTATLGETFAEAGAEFMDTVIQNVMTNSPFLQGAGGAATMGALFGAPMGAAAGGAEYYAGRRASAKMRENNGGKDEGLPDVSETPTTKPKTTPFGPQLDLFDGPNQPKVGIRDMFSGTMEDAGARERAKDEISAEVEREYSELIKGYQVGNIPVDRETASKVRQMAAENVLQRRDDPRRKQLEEDYAFQQQARREEERRRTVLTGEPESDVRLWDRGVPEEASEIMGDAFERAQLRRDQSTQRENLYPQIREGEPVPPTPKPKKRDLTNQGEMDFQFSEGGEQTDMFGAEPLGRAQEVPAKAAADASIEERSASRKARIDALKGSASEGTPTPRTIEGVRTKLGPKLGKSKNVNVVQTVDELPDAGNKSATTKGYFDGKKVWLVADNLPEGEEGATVLHEVKHYYDQLADEGDKLSSRSLRSIVGTEANTKLAAKIGSLKGNKVAEAAAKLAKAAATKNGKLDQKLYNEELLAYFLEEADLARTEGRPLARAAGVVKDIVAAIKTYLRDKGVNFDISDNDLYYLGRQLRTRFAEETSAPKGTEGKSTVIGKKAKNFQARVDAGEETFTSPLETDKEERLELDDSKATLARSSWKIAEDLEQAFHENDYRTLEDVVDHEPLFREYPFLRHIRVQKMPVDDGHTQASWNEEGNRIEISDTMLGKTQGEILSVLLHEVQHAIQDHENFAPGGNSQMFVTKKVQPFVEVKKMYDGFLRSTDPKKLLDSLARGKFFDSDTLAELDDKAQQLDREHALQEIFSAILGKDDTVKSVPGLARIWTNMYVELAGKMVESATNDLSGQKLYEHLAGELEARTVQYRRSMTAEERKEETFWETAARMEKDRTDLNKLIDGRFDERVKPEYRQNAGRSSVAVARPKKSAKVKVAGVPNMLVTADQAAKGVYGKTDVMTVRMKAWGWVQGLLRAGGALPLNLLEIKTNFSGEAQAAGMGAVQAKRDLDYAIDTSPNSAALRELINEIGEASGESRKNLLASLKQLDKTAWDKYTNARRLIRSYSLEIVEAMNAMGIRFDAKTENVVDKIIESIENDDYTTRSYKINAPRGEGAKWAHRMAAAANLTVFGQAGNEIRAAINKHAKRRGWDAFGTRLEQDKARRGIVRNAVQFFIENDLHIPEDLAKWNIKDLRAKHRERLINLHEAYIGDQNYELIDNARMIDDLLKVQAEHDTSRVEQLAEKLVAQILGLTDPRTVTRMAKAYQSTRMNMTIITPRESIPPEIRDLLGEYDDEVHNIFTTLVRQGEFVANIRMLNEMALEGEGKWFFTSKNHNPKIHEYQLKGDTFGPLRNMHTTKTIGRWLDAEQERKLVFRDILNSLGLADEFINPLDLAIRYALDKSIPALARLNKGVTVVWNLAGTGFNLIGSPFLLAKDGNYDIESMKKGARVGWELIALVKKRTNEGTPMLREEVMEMIRRSLIDSVQVGELQQVEVDQLLKELSPRNALLETADTLKTVVTDIFAVSDAWTKLANYYAQRKFIQQLHLAAGEPDYAKQLAALEKQKDNGDITEAEFAQRAAPIKKPLEEYARVAAERVRRTNMSYLRAPTSVKWLEKNGITMFGLYMWESWRSTAASFQIAKEDIDRAFQTENPKVRNLLLTHAAARIGGTLAATAFNSTITAALGSGLALLIAGVSGEDPEDDEAKRQAGLYGVPKYMRGKQLWWLGKDSNDKDIYFDVGRADPIGPVNDVGRNLLFAALTGEKVYLDAASSAFTDMFIVNTAWSKAILPLFTDKAGRPTMANDFPELYAALRTSIVDSTWGIVSPQGADRFLRTSEIFTPKLLTTSIGTSLSAWEGLDEPGHLEFTKGLGMKVIRYDPIESTMGAAKYVYSPVVENHRSIIKQYVYTGGLEPNRATLEGLYKAAVADERASFSETVPTVQAAKLNGATRTELMKAMKDGNMNPQQASAVYNNVFRFSTLSDEAITGWRTEELKGVEDPLKRGEIRAKYKKLTEMFREFDKEHNHLIKE